MGNLDNFGTHSKQSNLPRMNRNTHMSSSLPVLHLDQDLAQKWQSLIKHLQSLNSVVVAYSGGVDSSLLAVAAHLALAPQMLAVTIRSVVETDEIMTTASAIAAQYGFPHQFIEYDKLEDPGYVANTPNRCYVCKTVDLSIISRIASQAGICSVLLGANAEDQSDYRPGLKAARDLNVLSPLADAGLTKAEVRILARELGLGNWNHPSSPCLASRIPYGIAVTREKLEQIAVGESYLRALNFKVVRVRNTGPTAKIEVPADQIERLLTLRQVVLAYFKQIGFQYVTIDLEGYRQGSLNEVLSSEIQ
jgi:pyridinium-3,5-biscarboxylic acid mononucleotide sulfurtransferase